MAKISTVSLDEVELFLPEFDSLEEIGRGAFATTFKALRDGKVVAIKILDPIRANFRRREPEIVALKKINSPYIVKLLEVGTFIRGKLVYPYLVCEYIDGVELKYFLKKRKTFSNVSLLSFSWVMATALDHMWQHKIIHRDIKPANILIQTKNRGIPKVIDFGFAKHLENGPKDPGNSPGTPMYMAPEQIKKGKTVDIRSDLFALGIILYEMAAGVHPFITEKTVDVVKENICTIRPALPSSYNHQLDLNIEQLIMKLLNKDPVKRYQDPKELLKHIENIKVERR